MSEAIISRKIEKIIETIINTIYVDVEIPVYNPPLSNLVTVSTTYTVPSNLTGNQITVSLAGAKGADSNTARGSNGELITQTLTVEPGEEISVYIGNEGVNGGNGEPSSFGTYMIANGGISATNSYNNSIINDSISTNPSGAGYAIILYGLEEEAVE